MEIDIRGSQGNARFLMGSAERWAKQLEWDQSAIDEMMEDMESGDYNHLLDVIEEKFKYVVTLIGRDGEDDE
jgi:hypothetical protein